MRNLLHLTDNYFNIVGKFASAIARSWPFLQYRYNLHSHTHMHICNIISIHTQTCMMHTCVCMQMHTHTSACAHAHIHKYIYTHMYAFVYMYVHRRIIIAIITDSLKGQTHRGYGMERVQIMWTSHNWSVHVVVWLRAVNIYRASWNHIYI